MGPSGDSDYLIVFITDELNKVGSLRVVSDTFATHASLLYDFTVTDCCGAQNGSTQGHVTVLGYFLTSIFRKQE